jgi:hypothetical protein
MLVSPVSIVLPLPYTHLHLKITLTRMTKCLGFIKKQWSLGIGGALDKEVLQLILVLKGYRNADIM